MSDEKKISILDLVIYLLEKKWIFIISMLCFSITGVTYSLLTTKFYTAKAVILPSQKSMPSGLGSLVGDLPVSGILKNFDLFGSNDVDQFMSILESRRLAERVIDSLNLKKYYLPKKIKKVPPIEDILKTFNKSVEIKEDDYNNIIVQATDTSKFMATDISNRMVKELDRISYELSMENAKNSRVFFEERLRIIKAALDTASNHLTQFQVENSYIDIDEQARSSVDALAEIEKQKIILDLQIDQIGMRYGADNQRFKELQRDRATLARKLKSYYENGTGELLISLKNAPALSVKYANLLRDVKVQEAVYRFALQMYEQSKFNEANNIPSVQVLEWAKAPEKRSRPKRAILCIVFFSFGFVITSTGILLWKWYTIQKQNDTGTYTKLHRIFALLNLRR